MERKAQDQQDETGGGGKGDGERGIGAPGGERIGAALEYRELAERLLQRAYGRQRALVVGERDIHDSGAGTHDGQRLRVAENIEQLAADDARGFGRCGDHHAVGIGDQDLPAGGGGARGARLIEFGLHAPPGIGAIAPARPFQPLPQYLGDGLDILGSVGQRAAPVIQNLHEGADGDRDQKGDDERGYRTPQSRLCSEEAFIGRLRDRLRQSLDGIGTRRRMRSLGARHVVPPCRIVLKLDP